MNFLQMKTTYIKFICVRNLPFEMLLCVCCSNIVAANTIVPQFSILALSISIKNTPYKMLANNNIEKHYITSD